MANDPTRLIQPRPPIRLWPGVTALVLQWLVAIVSFLVIDDGFIYAVGGSVLFGLVILVWWLFFSRAAWLERLAGVALMAAAVIVVRPVVHPSVSNGMMSAMQPIFSIPLLGIGLVGWAAVSHRLSGAVRIPVMAVALVLAAAVMAIVRTDGISSSGSQMHWRWTPDAEQRLLARGNDDPVRPAAPAVAEAPKEAAPAPATPSDTRPALSVTAAREEGGTVPAVLAKAEWPGFRGAERDGVVRGVRIGTEWSQTPPVALWRKPIGPGWSSFAVRGNVIFTQEQRGDDEIVAAYSLTTGEPVWRHRDPARFWESNGGAGPRGTPTLSDDGHVYALGGTGILNALDAATGKVVWMRDAAADTKKTIPAWGISSSPVVIDDLVVVGVDGQLAAYARATGALRWQGPVNGGSYSSPHLMTIDGVTQILLPSGAGLTSVATDGTPLWEHHWSGGTIVQPARTTEGDLLMSVLGGTGGAGIRRIGVAHTSGKWTTEERWTSNGLKPYFNDYVVNKGHAYGFDGTILASIDLSDGKRTWKGGRYGGGQLVLLADQDLLLVISEEGELGLVRAVPDQFTELARFKALDGKTWNHPVVVGDVLLVRNGEEMAAFRLPPVKP